MPPFTSLWLLVFLLCSSSAFAQSTVSWSTAVTLCRSTYGLSSPSRVITQTSTTRGTTTIRYTFTTTPVKTVTPKQITITQTVRGTAPNTIRVSSTVTTKVTSIFTTTSTQTLVAPESTTTLTVPWLYETPVRVEPTITLVGAPPIPAVSDTCPGAEPVAIVAKKNRRSRIETIEDEQPAAEWPPSLEVRQAATPSYLRRIDCVVISKAAKIVIVQATGSLLTFTTSAPTTTIQYTEVPTSTSTVYLPSQSVRGSTTTTTTYTLTSIPVSTYIQDSEVTALSSTMQPVSTIYPQCAPENGAWKVGGYKIAADGFEPASPTASNQFTEQEFIKTNITDAAECCAACLLDPTCAASYKYGHPGYWLCRLVTRTDGICDTANPLRLNIVTVPPSNDSHYRNFNAAIFNNKCGRIVDGALRG